MPFKSKAQQRFMFASEAEGELPKGTAKRWANETEKKKGGIEALPEKVKPSKKTAGEMAKVALTRWQKELDKGNDFLAGTNRGSWFEEGAIPDLSRASTAHNVLNFDPKNEKKQTIFSLHRDKMRGLPNDILPQSQKLQEMLRYNTKKNNDKRFRLWDESQAALKDSKPKPSAISPRISALQESIHPSLYAYLTADSTHPYLKEELPRIIEDGRAKMRAVREAEQEAQAARQAFQDSLSSPAPISDIGESVARAGSKSNLLRNLGIGA
jgi:hypothetical protein